MNIELKEREFGDLLGLCFQLPVAHFAKLFIIVVILGLPTLGVNIAVLPMLEAVEEIDPDADIEEVLPVLGMAGLAILGGIIATLIIAPIQQGACILVVAGSFTGKHLPLSTCLMQSLRRLLSLIALSFSVGIIVFFGLLLFIVPGIIFLTWFYVAAPALMVEKLSFASAMGRSRELSKGHRVLIFAFIFIVSFIVGSVSGFIRPVLEVLPIHSVAVEVILYVVVTTVSMVAVAAPVVFYFQLRVVKESFDVEALTSLVDAIAERGRADA